MVGEGRAGTASYINQAAAVRAGSGTSLSVLRLGMKGGILISSMTPLDPIDVKPCDVGGRYERDGVSIGELRGDQLLIMKGQRTKVDLGNGRRQL